MNPQAFAIHNQTHADRTVDRKLTRRQFLKASTATGGLVIGFHLFGGNRMAFAQEQGAPAAPAKPAIPPNAFLRIAKDGSVTVQVKHLEFGQGY